MRTNEIQAKKQLGPIMSAEEFKRLGASEYVYVNRIPEAEARKLIASIGNEQVAAKDASGLWGLYGATGELLAMGNSSQTMTEMAFHHDMAIAPLN